MSAMRLFVPITKVDAVQRMVYGVAALEQADKSGEIFDYDSSKPYIEEWSAEAAKHSGGKSLGNIRAMHGKVAAGVAKQLVFNDPDKQVEVGAKIVDDNEWNKVEEGVYTGFSIGGDYVKRWQDNGLARYTAKISEISIVDNPAMPGAHFMMFKADGITEERSFVKYEESAVHITNEMVTTRAQALAKSAGASGFADFIKEARTQLEKEAGGETYSAEMDNQPKTDAGMVRPSGRATITTAEGVENNHEVPDTTISEEDTKEVVVPKGSEPGNTGDSELRPGQGATHPAGIAKGTEVTNQDPRNEVVQGWQAKDGSFHISKAAAMTHNASLTGPGADLTKAIEAANKAVTAAKGADINDSKVIDEEEKRKAKEKADKAAGDKKRDLPPWMGKAAGGDNPYGNVSYADPGHKADKKARYPVDTPKHIRAAWSYINMPKNHTGYTPAQVSSIKDKVLAAWKDKIGGEPPSVTEKSFSALRLQKGMHAVSRLACLIEELDWLHQSAENEAEWEKDGSAVPAQLKGDIASLVGTLKNMLDEETSEMFDNDELEILADELAMAATGVPETQLIKFVEYMGGRALSKSNNGATVHALLKAAAMPKVHMDKIQAMHDHCAEMGAKCDMGSMGKAVGEGTLSKAQFDAIQAENVELKGLVKTAVASINQMAIDLAEVRNQPAAPQAPVRLQVVSKGDDNRFGEVPGGRGDQAAQDLLKSFSPETLATAAIGLVHRGGGQRMDGMFKG